MKKILLILVTLGIGTLLWSQDKVIVIEKGQESPYQGVLVPEEEYRKLYEAYQTIQKYKELENTLEYQILKTTEFLKLKDEEIEIWKTKYELEKQMRLELEQQALKDRFKIKALTVTTSVGLSISLAELIGASVFVIFYNTMMK